MNTSQVRFAQRKLQAHGVTVDENGLLDEATERAVESQLKRRPELPAAWKEWSTTRKVVAFLQLLATDAGVDVGSIDGLWGPNTDFGYSSLRHLDEHGQLPPNWRDIPQPPVTNPNHWPAEDEPALRAFYGPVGTHLKRVQLPYPHKLSWDKNVVLNSFSCHEMVGESLQRVLTQVFDHYGQERISKLGLDLFGGCFNKRKKRGGSSWSMHAWAIALDYDPERNRLHWNRNEARFARPEYDAWWRFWEAEGWVSLGRARNFDWMHIQAARP